MLAHGRTVNNAEEPPAASTARPEDQVASQAQQPLVYPSTALASVARADEAVQVVQQVPEWLELKDGYEHCWLCGSFVTEAHVRTDKHLRRLYWYKSRTVSLETEVLESRPAWMEKKDGYDHCTLCRVFATDGHLVAARHLKNVEWWEQWGQQESRPKLEGGQEWSKGPPDFWGNPAHFEWRNGWWWCLLCEQCADGPHTQGQKHRRALGWGPGNSLTNGVPGVARNDAREPLAEPEPCGAGWDRSSAHVSEGTAAASSAVFTDPWQASYSRDHDRLLYYNSETGERSWTAPSQADTEGAAAWGSPWPGRS